MFEVFGSGPGLEKRCISGSRKKDEFILNESRNNSAFVPLADFTSKTLYSEKIGAAYGEFKSKFGKLGYQISLKPDKNTSIQFQVSYRGAEKSMINDRNAVYVLNAGVSRTILKGDGTLAFNIQDVLNSRAREFIYNGPDYTQYSFMQFAPQQFTLSFTYRFKQGEKVDQPKRKKDVNSNFRGEDEGPM